MNDEHRLLERERLAALAAPAGSDLTFLRVTPLRPCPYLPDRLERKVITALTGPDASTEYDAMLQAGFRRSHIASYRPACPGCRACVSVRVCVDTHEPSRSLRRVAARNDGVTLTIMPPLARTDHFSLFRRYLDARHADGEMANMDVGDYRALIEESFVESHVAEFREADGRLYGVCAFDAVGDGLSAVYSFFEPAREKDSPGSYMILRLIAEARNRGLPYLYLGYWIDRCEKMTYKARFRPIEMLGPEGWTILDD
jgi:arginine-tRNA-protein transferase